MKIRGIFFLVVTVGVLVGLFVLLKPKSQDDPMVGGDPFLKLTFKGTSATSTNKVFNIIVKNRKIVSGNNTLQATEGDSVTMNLTVDEGGEVHLHGYNKMVELEKNVQGNIVFTANLTGRFPFELEDSKTDLGVLEVQPKN